MRLDRNTNPDGKGKYAVVKLRPAAGLNAQGCINLLERAGLLSFGTKAGGQIRGLGAQGLRAGGGADDCAPARAMGADRARVHRTAHRRSFLTTQ
jgi:hypothetical protein